MGVGDAWIAAEINPVTGEITSINQIVDVENDIIQITGFAELSKLQLVETEIQYSKQQRLTIFLLAFMLNLIGKIAV